MSVSENQGKKLFRAEALAQLEALVWSIIGSMTTTVDGSGILLRGGRILRVESASAGQVREMLVKVGDTVSAGQPVATLLQPELEDEVAARAATVTSVSQMPSTPESLMAVLQNQLLVEVFSGAGPPLRAEIALQAQPANPSGYAGSHVTAARRPTFCAPPAHSASKPAGGVWTSLGCVSGGPRSSSSGSSATSSSSKVSARKRCSSTIPGVDRGGSRRRTSTRGTPASR